MEMWQIWVALGWMAFIAILVALATVVFGLVLHRRGRVTDRTSMPGRDQNLMPPIDVPPERRRNDQ